MRVVACCILRVERERIRSLTVSTSTRVRQFFKGRRKGKLVFDIMGAVERRLADILGVSVFGEQVLEFLGLGKDVLQGLFFGFGVLGREVVQIDILR